MNASHVMDVKMRRMEIENAIAELLRELEKDTLLEIDSISYQRQGIQKGSKAPEIKSVNIKLLV